MSDIATTDPIVAVAVPPALEVVRQRALDLLLADAPLHGELSQIVEIDTVLSGLMLRLTRCPLYENADEESLEFADAMDRIGRASLVQAISNLPGLPDRRRRDSVEQVCRHWVHSVAVAAAARWIASTGEYDDMEEAFFAGLMHDVAGDCCAPDEACDECRVKQIAARWRLGERVTQVARALPSARTGTDVDEIEVGYRKLDETTQKLLAVVRDADRIATAAGFGALPAADTEQSDTGDAADSDTAAAMESIRLELAHAAALLGFDGTKAEDLARVLTNEEMRCGATEPQELSRGTAAERLAEAHRRILATRRLGSVADIVSQGLRAIREGLDLDRVLLLEPHPTDPFRLQGRAVSDPSDLTYAGGVHGVGVELDGAGALQQAMERGRAVRGLCPRQDIRVLEQLGVDSFGGAVLRAGSKPMGLLVADRFLSGQDVDDDDVRQLELLSDALGLVLDNVVLGMQSRKLRTLAEKDELTGINNRRNIMRILSSEIERSRRFGTPLSIALLDVDLFKNWNDTHGHQVGDIVLQAVAQLIAACSREIDHYGRYGGEEFLIVLPETPVQHAVLYAERLRVTLAGHCAEMFEAYADTPLTVSIGVTAFHGEADEIEEMIRRSDCALYAAKDNGRNRVCVEAKSSLVAHEIAEE